MPINATRTEPLVTSPRGAQLRTFVRKPLAVGAAIVILVVVASVCAAPLIAPFGPLEQNLGDLLALPSAQHLLGTDELGRDLLSRLLWGGQPALLSVLIAIVVFAVVGMTLGVLGGFLGGRTDRVIGAVTDVMLAMPTILLMLAVLAIFSRSVPLTMGVLGFFASANLARLVRAVCIGIRNEPYIDAARVSGLGPWRIMTRHVAPALLGTLVVQLSLFSGIALTIQTGLGFLGLATPAPAPSWGGMVGEAASVLSQDGWFLFVSGGTIAAMTLAFGLLGDGLRDLAAERVGGFRGSVDALRRATTISDASHANNADVVLAVSNYRVAFATPHGVKEVVHGIDLEVRLGEIFGLVGESGSGKTVTALSLLGLLGEAGAVTGGGAWLRGQPISNSPHEALRQLRGRKIALISQEPMSSFDPLFTIGAQLTEVIRALTPTRGAAAKARAVELLRAVELDDPERVFHSYPHQLSGGMLQRVAIALALVGEPELLIADEPTTALDVTVQAGILDLLRSIRDRNAMAVVLVTHDLGVVADLCDRVAVMSDGRIIETAGVEELFAAPQNPYTRALIESTPNILSHDA